MWFSVYFVFNSLLTILMLLCEMVRSSYGRQDVSLVSMLSCTAVQVAQQSHYSSLDERCAGAELMMVITHHICCGLDRFKWPLIKCGVQRAFLWQIYKHSPDSLHPFIVFNLFAAVRLKGQV